MGFFSGLEGSLEKYIEGFFKDNFKGVLQPVDVAKRLAREMRDQRRTGLQEIYVPNRYEIHLSPQDMDSLALLADRLAQEMTEFITARAAEKQYTLLGPVQVTFQEHQEVATGQLKIESYFDETIIGGSKGLEDTLQFKPVRQLSGLNLPQPGSEPKAQLVVLEGEQRGHKFMINGSLAIIGRREICDIYLRDPSVSRRHAEISRRGQRYLIKDHESTNGTYVNGMKIKQTELMPQDVIKVGRVVLGFKVE